jgi:hypothetical protein
MAITAAQITRILVLLESVNFSMMRDQFESASSWSKIAAGENALDVARKIADRLVPLKAITDDDRNVLMAVLNVILYAAVNETPSAIPRLHPVYRAPVSEFKTDFRPDETLPRAAALKVRRGGR